MADERRRHQLYEELGTLLTKDSVDELMSYLPPVGWADVATKADLGALRAELKGDLAKLDGRIDKVEGRLIGLEGRFDGLEGRLDGRFDGLDGRFDGLDGRFGAVDGKMVGMEGRLEAKIAEAKEATRAWAVGTMLTTLLGMAGLIVAVILVKP